MSRKCYGSVPHPFGKKCSEGTGAGVLLGLEFLHVVSASGPGPLPRRRLAGVAGASVPGWTFRLATKARVSRCRASVCGELSPALEAGIGMSCLQLLSRCLSPS